jgi:hypothetical protein
VLHHTSFLTWILRAATEDKLLTAVCMMVVLPGRLLLLLQPLPPLQASDPTIESQMSQLRLVHAL